MVVKELVAKLGFKVDKNSANRANQGIENLKKAALRLGAVVAAGAAVKALIRMNEETASLGDQVAKTAQKLGVNAQALQELRHAAELTGVPVRTMDMALQRFTRRSAEAAKGTGEAKDALRELGVRLRDSNGRLRPTEELLGEVADGLKRAKTDGDRLRLSFKLFDSEGAALVNTLKNGKDALEAMRQEARDLGGVMDAELIEMSVEYTDTSTRMRKAIQGVKNMIAKQLLPFMIKSKNGTIEWIKANREWLRSNIIEAVKTTAQVITGLYRTLRAMAVGLREAWQNADPLAKTFLKIAAAAAALAIILASPILTILAIGAAIGLIADDFDAWGAGADSVIGRLDDKLGGFLSAVRDGKTDLFNFGEAFNFWKQNAIPIIGWIWKTFRKLDVWISTVFWDLFVKIFWTWPTMLTNKLIDWLVAKFKQSGVMRWVGNLAQTAGRILGQSGAPAALGSLAAGQRATAPVGSGAGMMGPPVSMAPTLNVTVNNAQGMNEKQLADEIGARMSEENDRMLRNAYGAYSPAPAQ